MKRPSLRSLWPLALLALSVGVTAPLWSADQETPSTVETDETGAEESVEGLPDEEEESEEVDWAAMAEPGEHHAHLDAFAGRWSFVMRIWSAPGGEPLEIQGEAEAAWQLDGRFLDTVYRAPMGDKAFIGRAIEGYDNFAGQYVRLWQDNMSTYTMVFKGACQGTTPNVAALEDEEEGEPGKPAATDEESEAAIPVYVRRVGAPFIDPVSGQNLRNQNVIAMFDENHYTLTSIIWSGKQSFINMQLDAVRLATP